MNEFPVAELGTTIAEIAHAWHGLAVLLMPVQAPLRPEWSRETAWRNTEGALRRLRPIVEMALLNEEVSYQYNRTLDKCAQTQPSIEVVVTALQDLNDLIVRDLSRYQFLVLSKEDTVAFSAPLSRFGVACSEFPSAKSNMTSAVKCYALHEWDACVFHCMRVLEPGLRWLVDQVNAGPFPLTLRTHVDFTTWEVILGNLIARINEELAASIPRTHQRDELLQFLGEIAPMFRWFKDAWRNHVMHDRNDPYDEGTSRSVLDNVSSFMITLAERKQSLATP